MQRVKTATAVTSKPAYSESGTPGYFIKGDAVAAIPATVPGQDWFNMVQEELRNLVVAAGLTPSSTDDTQLAQAIAALIAAQAVTVSPATETVAGIIKLATAAQALAGTDNTTAMSPADVASAIVNTTRGYTRQQYAVPVVMTGKAGAIALDAWLHQDVDITATAAVSFSAPIHGARGMYMTITLRAATALGITWDPTVYAASTTSTSVTPDVSLPTAFVAGKAMVLQFRCLDGAKWLLIGKCWEA